MSLKTYLYKDAFTGDEMFAVCYPMEEVDDIAYLVEGKYVTINPDGENIDVGCGNAFSGEEAEAPIQEGAQSVINLIHSHRLVQVGYTKADFLEYVKKYMEKNPARVRPFMQAAEPFVKKLLKNFNEFDFYMGESMDLEASLAMMFYKEDGITPMFYFFKDGLVLSYPGFGKSLDHPVGIAK
ncbi:Translationally-controlled tumor protein [Balamuthia mandrillaris]